MGAALERLGMSERLSIARSVLEGCDDRRDTRIGAYCPFHTESTPGGAFYYDAEIDLGFCHSCQQNGDLIDIFALRKGYSVDDPEAFRAFWREYGPDKLQKGKGKKDEGHHHDVEPGPWTARDVALSPRDLWLEKATAYVEDCAASLVRDCEFCREALTRRWGIAWDTAARWQVGYNAKDQFRPRASWGLPPVKNADGTEKKLFLPQGFIFPVFGDDGKLLRVKTRLDNPWENGPRYMAIEGGSRSCYGIWAAEANQKQVRVWVVVETERDAIWLNQELEVYGGIFGAMGVGTASLAPDARAHALLGKADLILNALDWDPAGKAASWKFAHAPNRFSWNQTYPHCIRWPVPDHVGKDAGDLFGKMPVWDWVAPALPPSLARWCEKMAARHMSPDDGATHG